MVRRKQKLNPGAACLTLLVVFTSMVLIGLVVGAVGLLETDPVRGVQLLLGLLALVAVGVLLKRQFVREEHQELLRSAASALDYLRSLSGHGFEAFLANFFRGREYRVDLTPRTTDQGADLLLFKDGRRIAVQAKRWNSTVGNKAVMEAHAGRSFYNTNEA